MRKAVYAALMALMGLVFLLTLTAWGQTGPGAEARELPGPCGPLATPLTPLPTGTAPS